ncbi:MAG: ParA family protein [Lachnospiraceae bacterium]|nr:ParA family protein [Lachnospiraceae bacterium]
MAITIAITNNKGGIGKTTSAVNIADVLRNIKYKVLMIDMDQQCNATSLYNAKSKDEYTIHDILMNDTDPKEAIQSTFMGDIIPGDELIGQDQSQLMHSPGGYMCLKTKVINKVKDMYDFIIIDTPPSLELAMSASLVCADGVIIPLRADRLSIEGLVRLNKVIMEAKESLNPDLEIYGALLTDYMPNTNLDREVLEGLPEKVKMMGLRSFKTAVRRCQEIKNAQAAGKSLYEFAPKCGAAQDYINVVVELLKIIKGEE